MKSEYLTVHCSEDRFVRMDFIDKVIGFGEVVDWVIEESCKKLLLSNTAIITVEDGETGNEITNIIAGEAYIRKRFPNAPLEVLALAREHEHNGWNNI